MTKSQSAILFSAAPAQTDYSALSAYPHAFVPSASYRYDPRPRSRKLAVIATLVSTAFHVSVLFGVGRTEKKTVRVSNEYVIPIQVEFAEIKELEEVDPLLSDEPGEEPDLSSLVPTQADVPIVPQSTDFVQQLDFSSLVEQPNLGASNLSVIPDHISRGGKIGAGIGTIFNLADLDRAPVAVFQGAPLLPSSLKQESASVSVRVQFIVAADGRVLDPTVVESTDDRFNDAAIKGVSKWKFKPGMKGGRKVNSRMAVPILFTVSGRD
jgi:periplasmic protein TonB